MDVQHLISTKTQTDPILFIFIIFVLHVLSSYLKAKNI